jgi:hypothetical protein
MNPAPPARPFYESTEPIDVNLYGDALLTILRFHPVVAIVNVLPILLEPERSPAVKMCVVRALTMLVTEVCTSPFRNVLMLSW